MPHLSGEELLSIISSEYPDIPVIVITGANDVETAVRCMKSGAFDYMVKPVEKSRLIGGVRRAIELLLAANRREEILLMRARRHLPLATVFEALDYAFSGIVGDRPFRTAHHGPAFALENNALLNIAECVHGLGVRLLGQTSNLANNRSGVVVQKRYLRIGRLTVVVE